VVGGGWRGGGWRGGGWRGGGWWVVGGGVVGGGARGGGEGWLAGRLPRVDAWGDRMGRGSRSSRSRLFERGGLQAPAQHVLQPPPAAHLVLAVALPEQLERLVAVRQQVGAEQGRQVLAAAPAAARLARPCACRSCRACAHRWLWPGCWRGHVLQHRPAARRLSPLEHRHEDGNLVVALLHLCGVKGRRHSLSDSGCVS
jgi:hypothetical protein